MIVGNVGAKDVMMYQYLEFLNLKILISFQFKKLLKKIGDYLYLKYKKILEFKI